MSLPSDVPQEIKSGQQQYVIWSEEHGGWWGPGENGYTRSLRKAGRYSKEKAAAVVARANRFVEPPAFHEIAFEAPVLP